MLTHVHRIVEFTLGMPIHRLAEGPTTLSVCPRRAKKDDDKLKFVIYVSAHLYCMYIYMNGYTNNIPHHCVYKHIDFCVE